jgi:hypothetical protein
MSAYFNSAVETMDLEQVHDRMKSLCVRINAAKGFVDTFDDNFVADLRRRSKELGQEITLEIDPSILAYVVSPYRLA